MCHSDGNERIFLRSIVIQKFYPTKWFKFTKCFPLINLNQKFFIWLENIFGKNICHFLCYKAKLWRLNMESPAALNDHTVFKSRHCCVPTCFDNFVHNFNKRCWKLFIQSGLCFSLRLRCLKMSLLHCTFFGFCVRFGCGHSFVDMDYTFGTNILTKLSQKR